LMASGSHQRRTANKPTVTAVTNQTSTAANMKLYRSGFG
jgi:hypothetical protein